MSPAFARSKPITAPLTAATPQEGCSSAGGTWKEFSNACKDICVSNKDKAFRVCTQVMSYGCECGPDRCFEPRTSACVPNPN